MSGSNAFLLWIFGYVLIVFPYGILEIKYSKLRLRFFIFWFYAFIGGIAFLFYNWR